MEVNKTDFIAKVKDADPGMEAKDVDPGMKAKETDPEKDVKDADPEMEVKETDLKECRTHIDEIDDQIIKLFEERMAVSEEVAMYKIRTGMQVLDPVREREKIQSLRKKAHGDFNANGAELLFRQIMAVSRKRQYQLLTERGRDDMPYEGEFTEKLRVSGSTVVFQGVEGAYSFAAMKKYFGDDISSFHAATWREAMEAVRCGKAVYPVLPIENSTAGIVSDIYDLMMEYGLYIVGGQIIRVEHVLLGLPGAKLEDIKKVCSHPQGLMQCKAFLEKHPDWEQITEKNTAGAAKAVSRDADIRKAAIASREAGKVYGLSVLAENICENRKNETRFIIVSRNPVYESCSDTVSICFELPHESGSLYNMLSHIIFNGLNMTRIESRPIPGRNWEYRFFVDFEGNLRDSAVKNALKGIASEALRMRVLGNYVEYS